MAEYHYGCEKCKFILKFNKPQDAPFDYQHFYHNENMYKEETSMCDGQFYRIWKPTTVVIKDYKKESIYK